MYLLYSLFVFSILAAFSMITFRLWEMGNGKIPFPDREQFSKRIHIFAIWEKKIWEDGKKIMFHVFAFSLRVVVLWIDETRKLIRKLIVRTEEALMKKMVNEGKPGATSFFLKDIAEHKKRMRVKNRM